MSTPTAALSISAAAARDGIRLSPLRLSARAKAAWTVLAALAVGTAVVRAPHLELLATAPLIIRFHIVAAVTALLVGTALMVGRKGRAMHKALGWTWVVAMTTVAVSSLFITEINPGRYSGIHLLSGWVIIAVPMGVAAIRRGKPRAHRRTMTGLFVGGLIIAGAFTFVPGRLMWRVFMG